MKHQQEGIWAIDKISFFSLITICIIGRKTFELRFRVDDGLAISFSSSMLRFLLLFLQLFGLVRCRNARDLARWDREINISLRNNFHHCPVTFLSSEEQVDLRQIPSAANQFVVQRIYPKRSEMMLFQAQPPTITKAHRDYMIELSKKNFTYSVWGKETFLKWQIPKNHPGQNRSNCLHITELATHSNPVYYAFYEEYKNIDRAFYLAFLEHALIHPAGIVFNECGDYYGEESCGNRFLDLTKKRIAVCRGYLRRARFQWQQIRANTSSTLHFENTFEEKCSLPRIIISKNKKKTKKIQQIPIENEVFVINALWDRTYFHFIVDSLARLAHHYEYLLDHPEIKLHLASEEDYSLPSIPQQQQAKRMREQIFQLLGFNTSRILSGPIFARKVYLPRTLRCGNAISNPIEVRLIARYLLQATKTHFKQYYPELVPYLLQAHRMRYSLSHSRRMNPSSSFLPLLKKYNHTSSLRLNQLPASFLQQTSLRWPAMIPPEFIERQKQKSKHLLLMQRFPVNQTRPGSREWSDIQFTALIYAFAKAYPDHNIVPLSSLRQEQGQYCLACDIFLYSQGDVLVGMHGSGFTNAMFLPPHGLLVEIVDDMNDLHMPICGYHGVFAGLFGLHHYLFAHYLPGKQVIDEYVEEIAEDSARFYQFVLRYQERKLWKNERVEIYWNSTGSASFRP